MQYHIQTLVKHLFDKDSFEQVSVEELKQFTHDYPYAAVGQFLYAKKLKDSGAYNSDDQGQQASLYFHNALWLRWQLDQKEEAPAVKAEEPAQQPGFRIVVQMPKNSAAAYEPEEESEENKVEQDPILQTPPPLEVARVKPDEEKALQVNENGSLVEQAASAVAIAEEVLTPAENTEADDIVPAVEPVVGEADIDDVVPAIEVPAEMANPGAVPVEVDDVVPAIETEEADTDDVVPAIEATAAEVQPELVAEPVAAEEPEVPEPVAEVEQPNPFGYTPASKELKISVDLGEPIFESYHTIDYFASQGIKLMAEDLKDKMGKQLKSFTDWLRSMKRISGHIESSTSIDEVTHQSIQRIAEHSVEEKEVVTEAMAEVWAKQGNRSKAIRIYEKLSLLNPGKSTYFATRIEQLKAR